MPKVRIPGVGVVAFPDSMSADAIARTAERMHAGSAGTSPAAPAPEMSMARMAGIGMATAHPAGMGLARAGIEALPTAGALAGETAGAGLGATVGAAGGPLAAATGYAGGVAGGAAGGATGRLARNAVAMSPAGEFLDIPAPGSLTEGVGGEAGRQAGASAIGIPAAGAAARTAGVLTGRTLSRAGAVAENVARSSNLRVSPKALLKNAERLLEEAKLIGGAEVAAVKKKIQSFLGSQPHSMSMVRLHNLRQAMDDIARPIHDAMKIAGKGGPPVGPKMALRGRFAKAVADDARAFLKDNVPGYAPAMRSSERAIASMKRIPRVSEGPIHGSLTNPFGAPELLTRTLMGPSAMGGYGRMLENPAVQSLLAQGPRGALLLQELLQGSSPDTTQGGMP